jgi:hypothetical protein
MTRRAGSGGGAVTAAFESALWHQAVVALLIFGAFALAWLGLRARLARRGTLGQPAPHPPEPAWRRLLRAGFGLLWLFDGILQAQPRMALGLPSQVLYPAADGSPAWARGAVHWAGGIWAHHPVQAAASAVWIQIGAGLWLLAAPRGTWSRLAGVASLGWGLAVWVFGESFGGIFAAGLTWLTGAPGAALAYAAAGVLLALPERAWHTPRLGRLVLAGLGVFLAGMALLQAWPGRGFWQGTTTHGQAGPLAGFVASMASLPQPHLLAGWVAGFGSFAAAHGFAVNLAAVAALGLTGIAFATGRARLAGPAAAVFTLVCLADWVLIQDLGFFGGLGTDPGSMLPFALLAGSGYLALAHPAGGAAVGGERVGPWARRSSIRSASGGAT